MLLVKVVSSSYGKHFKEEWTSAKSYPSSYLNSIGADFKVISLNVREETIRFQLWQLANNPRFAGIKTLYCRGAMGGIFVFSCEESIPIQDISDALRELWSSCGRGMIPASVVLVDPSYEILEEINTLENFSERLVQIKNEFGDLISFWIGPKWGPTENERCLENLGEKILNYIYSPPSLSDEFHSIFPKKLLPRKEILVKWLEKILPLSNWDYDKELSIITQQGLFIINPVSNRVYLIPKNCQLCRDKCSWVRRYVCIDLEGWKGWNNCELTDKELLFLSKAWIIANNKYDNSVKEKIEAALQTPCAKY